MLQHGIAQNLACGIEAHEHLQFSAEAHGGAFHGGTGKLALVVVHFVDDKLIVFATDVLCQLVVGGHFELVQTHHALDTVGERQFVLLLDGTCRHLVDPGQQ